jgi:hypothetical protein
LGYASDSISRYPKTYPTKVLAADGSPWTPVDAGGEENSLKTRFAAVLLDVDGRERTSTDVYGWLPGPDSQSVVPTPWIPSVAPAVHAECSAGAGVDALA